MGGRVGGGKEETALRMEEFVVTTPNSPETKNRHFVRHGKERRLALMGPSLQGNLLRRGGRKKSILIAVVIIGRDLLHIESFLSERGGEATVQSCERRIEFKQKKAAPSTSTAFPYDAGKSRPERRK